MTRRNITYETRLVEAKGVWRDGKTANIDTLYLCKKNHETQQSPRKMLHGYLI